MKKISLVSFFIATLIGLAGCDSTGGGHYDEQIVLQGMMIVGNPLRIRLTHTLPMHVTYDAQAVGVTGALVRISADSASYVLSEEPEESAGGGFYSFADTTIKVIAGGDYRIHVESGNHILDAQTVGAGPTSFSYQSADTVEYGDANNLLSLHWHTDSLAAGYVILIENLEPDWYADYRAVSGNNGPDPVPWSLMQVPRIDDSLRIPWVALGFTGRHRVRVMTCDRNLWNYMWTYYPPGQSDVPPVSNVQGGLGIFSVGGVDTTGFMLTDSISDGPNNP